MVVNAAVSLQCCRVSDAVGCCGSAPFWYNCVMSSCTLVIIMDLLKGCHLNKCSSS